MIRFVFAAVLIGHGLAHAGGFIAAWTKTPSGYSDHPWVFSDTVSLQSSVGRAFGLLWLVAMIGFASAGLGLLMGQDWWPTLAVSAATVSLVAIVPWWHAVPPGAWTGAALDVLIILLGLLPIGNQVVDLVK
jgi:hypothetical protein